jgi:hypothetical protein
MTDRNPMTLTARYNSVQYMYQHTCRGFYGNILARLVRRR